MNVGREMALPMETIIGGPLQAVVKAQSMAAHETASFIQNVGLQDGKARTVGFSFERQALAADGNSTATETVNMNVPLLTILPVPFIRVEAATVDFECNVSSTEVTTSSHDLGVDASASGSYWGTKVSVKASYSYQKTSKSQVDKSASLKVQVKAVQDEVPGGLAKVLQILESAVSDSNTSQSKNPTPTPAQDQDPG